MDIKVIKDKGVQPCKEAPKPNMEGVKTTGIKVRGTGAATSVKKKCYGLTY